MLILLNTIYVDLGVADCLSSDVTMIEVWVTRLLYFTIFPTKVLIHGLMVQSHLRFTQLLQLHGQLRELFLALQMQ